MVLGRPDRVGYLVWPRQTESQCRAAVGLGNALRCERMLLSGRKAVNNVFVPGEEKYAIAPFAILRGTDLPSDLLGRVCDPGYCPKLLPGKLNGRQRYRPRER